MEVPGDALIGGREVLAVAAPRSEELHDLQQGQRDVMCGALRGTLARSAKRGHAELTAGTSELRTAELKFLEFRILTVPPA